MLTARVHHAPRTATGVTGPMAGKVHMWASGTLCSPRPVLFAYPPSGCDLGTLSRCPYRSTQTECRTMSGTKCGAIHWPECGAIQRGTSTSQAPCIPNRVVGSSACSVSNVVIGVGVWLSVRDQAAKGPDPFTVTPTIPPIELQKTQKVVGWQE